jgi:hypothetical protein
MRTILILSTIFFLASASSAFGQASDYVPMVGFPGLENASGLTTQQYVQAIYNLAISVGALLAVIQIIFAGVEYMFSDVVTSKSAAIKRIRGSLLGLLIIISAVLLLQTINPDLLNLDIFKNAPAIETILSDQKDTQTACEKDAKSYECCNSQGGRFEILGGSGGQSLCRNVEADIPKTGDTNQDRLNCIEAGNTWNGSCIVSETKNFNYNDVRFVNNTYTLPIDIYEGIDTNQLMNIMETKCLPKQLNNRGVQSGSNITFSCE